MKNWSLVKLGSGKARRRLFFKLRSAKSRAEQDGAGASEARRAIAADLGVTEDEVSEMDVRMAGRDFSLDAPLTADSDVAHVDVLSDGVADQEELVAQRQEQLQLRGAIEDAAGKLDEKERYILEHRLLSEEPETLAEIGEVFGFSRERARQLETRVIKKLRQSLGSLRALPAPA
jgi:RNA polymerase sigma-32 factor